MDLFLSADNPPKPQKTKKPKQTSDKMVKERLLKPNISYKTVRITSLESNDVVTEGKKKKKKKSDFRLFIV